MRFFLNLYFYSWVFLSLLLIINISFFPNSTLGNENGECIIGNCVNGYGKFLYSNGTLYDGEWKQGQYDGIGKIKYPNESVYYGNFASGRENGSGYIVFPDGNKHKLKFAEGQLIDGESSLYDSWTKETNRLSSEEKVYLFKGEIYYKNRLYEKAIEQFTKYNEINPNNKMAQDYIEKAKKHIENVEDKEDEEDERVGGRVDFGYQGGGPVSYAGGQSSGKKKCRKYRQRTFTGPCVSQQKAINSHELKMCEEIDYKNETINGNKLSETAFDSTVSFMKNRKISLSNSLRECYAKKEEFDRQESVHARERKDELNKMEKKRENLNNKKRTFKY